MRLYHARESARGGTLDVRDEEECFTAIGKRTGVWLTTEAIDAEFTYEADVDAAKVEAYEVTPEGSPHQEFVVPGAVAATLGFQAA
jgi:hypothetical protein